jgi:hypothetical protein
MRILPITEPCLVFTMLSAKRPARGIDGYAHIHHMRYQLCFSCWARSFPATPVNRAHAARLTAPALICDLPTNLTDFDQILDFWFGQSSDGYTDKLCQAGKPVWHFHAGGLLAASRPNFTVDLEKRGHGNRSPCQPASGIAIRHFVWDLVSR